MKTVEDFDIFSLSIIQDKPATLYNKLKDNSTYIYIGSDKYIIPPGAMAISLPRGDELDSKFTGFQFKQDVRLDGYIKVIQIDEHYLVTFATEKFSNFPGGEEALNDIILLKVGNALLDIESLN